MDYARPAGQEAILNPATRNSLYAVAAALAITVVVTASVSWMLSLYGYSSTPQDIVAEAARWFLPMSAYLWGMFGIIDAAQRA